MRALVLAALAVAASGAGPAVAQPADTLAAAVPDGVAAPVARPAGPPAVLADSVRQRTPRGAVTRALLAPGLGQVYNRQPVKAPIAAALVVGGVVYAVDRQRRYRRIQRATIYAGCIQDVIPDDREFFAEVCAQDAPGYEDEWIALGSPAYATVRPARDRARGQRDISVLVAVVAYAFQAFDAYVFAELAGFDVSEDVAVRLDPHPEAPALRLRVRL